MTLLLLKVIRDPGTSVNLTGILFLHLTPSETSIHSLIETLGVIWVSSPSSCSENNVRHSMVAIPEFEHIMSVFGVDGWLHVGTEFITHVRDASVHGHTGFKDVYWHSWSINYNSPLSLGTFLSGLFLTHVILKSGLMSLLLLYFSLWWSRYLPLEGAKACKKLMKQPSHFVSPEYSLRSHNLIKMKKFYVPVMLIPSGHGLLCSGADFSSGPLPSFWNWIPPRLCGGRSGPRHQRIALQTTFGVRCCFQLCFTDEETSGQKGWLASHRQAVSAAIHTWQKHENVSLLLIGLWISVDIGKIAYSMLFP